MTATNLTQESQDSDSLQSRIQILFKEQEYGLHARTDQLFKWLMLFQWVAGVIAAIWIAPRSWAGSTFSIHTHVWAAVFLGGIISIYPVWLAAKQPGRPLTRHVMAAAQMLMGALLIHLSGGRIETHFHIFGSLAFLAFYRDRKVLITASVVVYVDHFIRGFFWPESVFGVLSAPIWRPIEHAAWVAFEVFFLSLSIRQSLTEMNAMAERQAELEQTNRQIETKVQERTQELQRSKERADRSERLLRTILDVLPQGVFWTDRDGRVQGSNQKFENDMQQKELGGKSLKSLPPIIADRAKMDTLLRKTLQEGKATGSLIEETTDANGRPRWLSLSIAPLHTSGGNVSGALLSYLDVTELKQAQAELVEARDAALDSVRMKSEFLANMSHEIRTPMNGVIGMINLLLDTQLQDEQREFAETVCSSAESLLTILNDILDFSKIEAGKLEFETVEIDTRQLVEETLDLMAEGAQFKGLELVGNIEAGSPAFVRGDPGRIRQILINLIGNAIKFTQSGEVVLRVSGTPTERNKYRLRFDVTDTGVGIAENAQEHLFESFTQADGSTTRKYGGTGLGLAISKKLVDLMGGEIGLESVPDVGTRVWFEISLPELIHPVNRPHNKLLPLKPLKVLIVDDNETNLNLLSRQLLNWEMNVVRAESGKEALGILQQNDEGEPFDLAILDMQMPEMDGLNLAKEIRKEYDVESLKLVILTSLGSGIPKADVQAGGIIECLQKPVRQSRLHRCLVEHSGSLHPKRTLHPKAAADNLTSKDQAAPANYGLRILLAEDNQVNQRVTSIQLQKLGCEVDLAINGEEAVKAIQAQSYDVILMDCQMPVMEGYEAARKIRQWESETSAQKPVHIIALTAHAMEGDRQKCLNAGMNDYVSKPISINKLKAAIATLTSGPKAP